MLEALNCPNCGAPIKVGQLKCEYCDSEFAASAPQEFKHYLIMDCAGLAQAAARQQRRKRGKGGSLV